MQNNKASRKIVDTRNRIIHGYDSVSEDFVYSRLSSGMFAQSRSCPVGI